MLAVYTSRNFPLFGVFLCPVMGRRRIYATDAARRRGRAQKAAERRKLRPRADVYLGKVIDLWNQTKDTTGITSDIEFAICLLDRLVICLLGFNHFHLMCAYTSLSETPLALGHVHTYEHACYKHAYVYVMITCHVLTRSITFW